MYGPPPPPPPPQQKKRNPWLWGCLGCGGAALLVLVLAVGCVAVLGGDAPAPPAGGGSAASGPAEESPPADSDAEAAEEEVVEEGPIGLEATPADFTPSILAQGDDYTSVRVTVTNNGDESIEVNPLFFTITDANGTVHDTADGLGADETQIGAVTLAPGENATGTVTASGSFEPARVTFTESLIGDSVTADVA
ncbi:DUF4352 domain-containing protein [Marinitenerispora sediminis]|uniref:DUF4352 domain-containing protein n=1 Tax=Marinitenerispora sediminis TaxID=1931232 RepID=A0A368T8K5_9ACTN|nr:DUF4352 domain-containing protein [Marinitenerispora sediminis]RCV54509.1 hypothetical protein DEF28_08125 [Marinitenerispora sediminis]RCV58723.1 hypothetical protein DEF24_12375 [Marinitenerispora sediminis]RCV61373.1 hypothetical protein DEF23_02495 [Marinitenerispora sediminis]